MTKIIRIVSAALVLMILTTIIGSYALAAEYKSVRAEARVNFHIITVKTGKGLLPAKIDFGFQRGYGNDAETGKIKSVYGEWTVKVYDERGRYVKTESSFGYSGVTVNGLRRNKTYTLYVYGPVAPKNTLVGYRIKKWSIYPSFYVKNTRNVSNMWISGRSIK